MDDKTSLKEDEEDSPCPVFQLRPLTFFGKFYILSFLINIMKLYRILKYDIKFCFDVRQKFTGSRYADFNHRLQVSEIGLRN